MANMSTDQRKRYRLMLDIDADTIDGLVDVLRDIATDAEIEGLPVRRVSSRGYMLDFIDKEA